MFKEEIIKRYSKDKNGKIIINISLPNQKFAFERFDTTTSYAHRDLHKDFAEYLYGCVNEIGNNSFVIRIDFPKKEEKNVNGHEIKKSITNYFTYMANLSRLDMRKIIYRTIFHITLSIVLLASLLFISPHVEDGALHTMMFIEGLTIAAWVFMWPVFSDFMYKVLHERKNMKIIKKILSAKVIIRFH